VADHTPGQLLGNGALFRPFPTRVRSLDDCGGGIQRLVLLSKRVRLTINLACHLSLRLADLKCRLDQSGCGGQSLIWSQRLI